MGSERHGRLARGDEDLNLPLLVTTLLEVQPPCQMGFNPFMAKRKSGKRKTGQGESEQASSERALTNPPPLN